MASVSSLDQDMRKLRMDRYTPSAAKEARRWIESVLQDDLPAGDLMQALRDGVALCRLVNLVSPPGVKYKQSTMPFIQMENISSFLRACEMPPLKLPSHDRFLTVDLYDNKDPAQVLQCLAAFSRRANAVDPQTFPTTIGVKGRSDNLSPQSTGPASPKVTKPSPYVTNTPQKPVSISSPTKTTLGRGGLASSSGPVSSWSSKADESKTAPAWNIHQYGYMGGANQGNQGVAFGGRRQIVSQQPEVPSLAEKEKRLREKMESQQRQQAEADELERISRAAEERQAQLEEERVWAEETRKEAAKLRRLQEEEAERRQTEFVRQDQLARSASNRPRVLSDARLNGQYLSQYQTSQSLIKAEPDPAPTEVDRIAELERQLAEARQQLAAKDPQPQPAIPDALPAVAAAPSPSLIPPRPSAPTPNTALEHTLHPQTGPKDDDEWAAAESDARARVSRDFEKANQDQALYKQQSRTPPPEPQLSFAEPVRHAVSGEEFGSASTNRIGRFLSSNPAPAPEQISRHVPAEANFNTTSELDQEDARRLASQRTTKAGAWASKSLLEREMERERERQREWEEAQKETASHNRDSTQGAGPGQTWDVHQYGYTGGDNQNRGSQGIGSTRRQIIGPRPLP